jgi:hypothetical protein
MVLSLLLQLVFHGLGLICVSLSKVGKAGTAIVALAAIFANIFVEKTLPR